MAPRFSVSAGYIYALPMIIWSLTYKITQFRCVASQNKQDYVVFTFLQTFTEIR